MICLFLLAGVVVGTIACSRLVKKYEAAFAETESGQSMTQVIERFGSPDVRDNKANAFLRYANGSCVVPCADRLWWEHPIFKGIEAWSVEFNAAGAVVGKAHWVSP